MMNWSSGGPVEAERAEQRWWSRPDGRVAALLLSMWVITIATHTVFVVSGARAPHHDVVPLWALFLMFAATEGVVIQLRVRRGGQVVGLSEIPMVLGLLGTSPALLLLARLFGGGAGLTIFRRQRGAKLAFNLALLSLQTAVGMAVFRVISRSQHGLLSGEWVATYAALLTTDILAVLLITLALSLNGDPGEWRRLPAALRGVPLVAVTTTFALIGALAVERDVRAMTLLGVVSLVAFLAYRAYMRQTQGHAQVEGLYAFTHALGGSLDIGEVARIVLDQARDQLRAETAELMVPGAGGQPFTRVRMTSQGGVETTWIDIVPADIWWAPATRGEPVLLRAVNHNRGRNPHRPVDGIAVPVTIGDSATGVLLVADSLPELATFDEDHVKLFQALANHAGVSLAKAHLVDRLRQEVSEKEHLALHDPLTSLPNRRQFNRMLEAALGGQSGAEESGSPATTMAIMLMDLDRFKEVNDALGHDIGDALLREVGGRLSRRLGNQGVVARLGGDEFAVLLPEVVSKAEAVRIAESITEELERPITIGHVTLNARASIGIAFSPEHGKDATVLLQRADVAMYAAKETRTGQRVYEPECDRNTPHRLALIADLRQAVERRELVVMFQPKLDPSSNTVAGAEALARWHHPRYGPIPPEEFIPLAEHTGLIRPLTLHVLEVALRRCAAWRRVGHDIHVAVNLSPNSLHDPTLIDIVTRMLGQSGVPARALTLEITESSLMSDPEGSLLTLDRLNALGVKLAIDDFGSGYSSLGRLRELPIHEVKIDKSFVQRIAVDHRDRAVVRSAVQLGHALDLEVVAEGVEDSNTYAHLTGEGCNLVQGYYVSEPLPADEFATWLAHHAGFGTRVLHSLDGPFDGPRALTTSPEPQPGRRRAAHRAEHRGIAV